LRSEISQEFLGGEPLSAIIYTNSKLTLQNIQVGSERFLNLFNLSTVSLLAIARCKLSPPISSFAFFKYPIMPTQGPAQE
jgi:hypothetical protein